jgi:hypothetical protein
MKKRCRLCGKLFNAQNHSDEAGPTCIKRWNNGNVLIKETALSLADKDMPTLAESLAKIERGPISPEEVNEMIPLAMKTGQFALKLLSSKNVKLEYKHVASLSRHSNDYVRAKAVAHDLCDWNILRVRLNDKANFVRRASIRKMNDVAEAQVLDFLNTKSK